MKNDGIDGDAREGLRCNVCGKFVSETERVGVGVGGYNLYGMVWKLCG